MVDVVSDEEVEPLSKEIDQYLHAFSQTTRARYVFKIVIPYLVLSGEKNAHDFKFQFLEFEFVS